MTNGAFDEGKLAAAQGGKLNENPYPAETTEHDEWEEGFWYARETNDDDEPNDQ